MQIGAALFLINLGLLGEIAVRGGWIGLEHPADRGREPYPSFFCTEEVKTFQQTFKLAYHVLDQCRYGALSKKPTGILLPRSNGRFGKLCNHVDKHPLLLGLDSEGGFRTTPAAKYPMGLCHAIAAQFMHRVVLARTKHYVMPQRSLVISTDSSAKDPWLSRHHVSWSWVEPRPGFLASIIEAIN